MFVAVSTVAHNKIFLVASPEKADGDAPFIGKVLKTPKSLGVEILTDADPFDTPQEKGLLMGSAFFFNVNFLEENGNECVCLSMG